jgi:hypothetical protein
MTTLSKSGVGRVASYALSLTSAVPAVIGASPAATVVPIRSVAPERVSHALTVEESQYKATSSSSILLNESHPGARFSGTARVYARQDEFEDDYEEVADFTFRDESDWTEIKAEIISVDKYSSIVADLSDIDWEA